MKRLTDKVVVITGGTSGIGRATAGICLEEGARVVTFGRTAEVPAGDDHAHAVRGDVTSVADLDRLFSETKQRWGGVDVLFINAGVVRLAPVADTSEVLFDDVVGTNMKGAFSTLRQAIPFLRNGASVIVTTSWLNRMGLPGSGVVAMTKAGLRALVRVAAAELGPRNIRVNALSPGATETPLWGKLGLPADTLRATGEAITAQVPLGRWGRADEVARAALFLASSDSSYLSGTELAVDGGLRQV